MKMKKWSMSMLIVMLAVVFTAGCSATTGTTPSAAPSDASQGASGEADKPKGGKFVFWDKSEFVKSYNDMMKARVEEFGKTNNVEVEYVVISPNELKTKLLAAIEAKNPPDLIVGDDFMEKQFVAMNQLVDVSDVISKLPLTKESLKFTQTNTQEQYLVPQAFLLGGGYLRKDLWDAKGLKLPETWMELKEQAKVITDAKNGIYALGFPMGASGGGDAESMVRDIILAWGGTLVDKDNKVVVNSKETLEALKFIASLYQEGLTPPSSLTWDDTGNNNAYLAGTVGFIINSGSVYSAMQKDKPELLEQTTLVSKLGGPAGKVVLGNGNAFSIFKNGKNTEAAKQFVSEFYEKEFYTKLVEGMGGMWQPVIEGGGDTPFWKDPSNKTAGWLEQTKHIIGAGNYPGPEDDLGAKSRSMQLGVKAVQRIVAEKMDPQKSLDQFEKELKALYGQ